MFYVLILLLVVAITFGPNLWVRSVMRRQAEELPALAGSGGELAVHLLERFNMADVVVERTSDGQDHYDAEARAVRLSERVFDGRSLTAVAVATHEVGHAIQHASGDTRLRLRTQLAPWVQNLARASVFALGIAPIVGLLGRHPLPFSVIAAIGMSGLVARVGLHLMTLPTELDASFGKALPILTDGEYVSEQQMGAVRQVLKAAAYTYVAAALADVLNLARWAHILLRR